MIVLLVLWDQQVKSFYFKEKTVMRFKKKGEGNLCNLRCNFLPREKRKWSKGQGQAKTGGRRGGFPK